MANIFHRPMFRRGGSVANGTGITSGLTTPKRGLVNQPGGYAGENDDDETDTLDNLDNTISSAAGFDIDPKKYDPNILKSAINTIRTELKPTAKESLGDWLTAFGASGTGSIGEKQTLGGALSNTAKTIEAIDEKRKQLVDKYAGTAAVAALRGMGKSSQTAMMKNAQLGVMAGEYKTIEEGIQKQIQMQSFQKLPHPEVIKSKIIKGYEDDYKKSNPNDVYASNKAEVDYQIRNAKSLPSGITEEDLAGEKRYLNPNTLTTSPDGKIIFNPKAINVGQQKAYAKEINKVFINPVNKKFYRFKGDYFEPIG
jgi:hypothetical protein